MKVEFTKTELEILEEMLQFPEAYSLTEHGIEIIKSMYDKMKDNNKH